MSQNLQLRELELLKEQKKLYKNLPHLHGWPWYKWAREFFESTNRMNFLCAGNQLSKSSTQIRKAIHWATEPSLWPGLWKTRPLTFWYLYPSKEIAHTEVTKKWINEFLPRNELKEHEQYGWEIERRDRWVWAIHFKTGVTIYFKTYAQDVQHLQAGTVWSIFGDEEIPWDIFPELGQRTKAVRGFFHLVFTATLGQLELKDIIEGKGRREKFPNAAKWQISMYDSQEYEDGTKSPWTDERIAEEIALIGDAKEVDRRIHGKFVVSGGLKYGGFNRDINVKQPLKLEEYKAWHIYSGVDIGSGLSPDGKKGHPSAICFIAVRPDFKYGRVFRGWVGDDVQTTAGDVINKYIELSSDLQIAQHFYDWHNKDFHIISQRAGIPFEPAEKGHETGETTLNTLFKNGMMDIDDIAELENLQRELGALLKDTPKTKAKDDFSDALRYGVTRIPWNFGAIRDKMLSENRILKPKIWVESCEEKLLRERLEFKKDIQTMGLPIQEVWEEEIAANNELYEA